MWHVLFRTKYAGSSVSTVVFPFESYEAAESAIKALRENQPLENSVKTEAIRLYQ